MVRYRAKSKASGELSEAELKAVLDTKARSEAVKSELGDLLTGHKRRLKSRPRRKPDQAKPDYQGLTGDWASHYNVACLYESHIPAQDRDDWRHDTMLELERATRRDGKPLTDLKAYRIASFMIALYYRQQNRFATRVCIFNGYPTELHCKDCKRHTESKRCAWLAVRPIERLDGEVIDHDGYRERLLDTVATDKALDLPDKWYEVNEVRQGLPLRLVEIAEKMDTGKPLDGKDRFYLCKLRKRYQKYLL